MVTVFRCFALTEEQVTAGVSAGETRDFLLHESWLATTQKHEYGAAQEHKQSSTMRDDTNVWVQKINCTS